MAHPASDPPVLFNGTFKPRSEVRIDFSDAGFVYGATVTDACRTFGGRPFRLPEHIDRFRRNCDACNVPLPYANLDLIRWSMELIAGQEDDVTLITCATPGPLPRYAGEPDGLAGPSTLLMHTVPINRHRYRPFFRDGARLRVAGHTSYSAGGLPDPTVKHRSRMHWWVAERRCEPGEIPLLLDGPEGSVTETPLASFLIVNNGAVVSPPRDRILESISLAQTAEICRDLGIPIEDRPISIEEARRADEAMITGTNFGLAGVCSIDGTPLPWLGPITERLMAGWNRRTGTDIAAECLRD